jgi:hypothetical protein
MSNVHHYNVTSCTQLVSTLAQISCELDLATSNSSATTSDVIPNTNISSKAANTNDTVTNDGEGNGGSTGTGTRVAPTSDESFIWWRSLRLIIIDSLGALLTPVIGGTSISG